MDDKAPESFTSDKLGVYTVIGDVAEGSFGKVKVAIHTVTGHRVAMKYISKAKMHTKAMRRRVKRESEYMRLLNSHPHIVKLYEVISTSTDIVFVLEYAGNDLFKHIVEDNACSIPPEEARRFFQQLISGIEHSHRLKIVHRDLKLENVLLDDDKNIKIADFGLSSEISDGDFLTTSCGSPNYAAPEVLNGSVYAGPEIDVWSAGVLLYVMIFGRYPFMEDEDEVHTMFARISRGEFELPLDTPPDTCSILSSMLVVDPIKRITIPEIMRHPYFLHNLPDYIEPLPEVPAILGTLSSLVTPPPLACDNILPGLGQIEDEIVKDLASRLSDISVDDVWEALRRDDGVQGNTMKVAYQLLRDRNRTGKDLANYANQERQAQILAMDPRNATSSPAPLSPQQMHDLGDNPFDAEFGDIVDADTEDEPANASPQSTFSVLSSSLPSNTIDSSRRSFTSPSARPRRTRWHFGITSNSHRMEIMQEIYKALRDSGMEWIDKKDLGGLGRTSRRRRRGGIERVPGLDGGDDIDMRAASTVFLIEARARVNDVVVLFNVQLYEAGPDDQFLVDFLHKRSYLASSAPGAGKYDMEHPNEEVVNREEVVVSPYLFMEAAYQLIIRLTT